MKRCCMVVAGLVLALAPASAGADSTVKVGPTCTLADAVAYADGTSELGCAAGIAAGTTTIVLPASASAYVVSSSLSFTGDAVLKGGGAAGTIIDGGGSVQVINVAPTANVTLSGVTITGGVSGNPNTGCTGSVLRRICPQENGNNGGGISNMGTLKLNRVLVTANSASGGTLPTPVAVVCSVGGCPAVAGQSAGNGGSGGGIFNDGQLTVDDSTVSGNHAGDGGSGTNGISGTGTLVSAGQAGGGGGNGGSGGGIYNNGRGLVLISDSTITENAAGAGGSAGAGSDSTVSLGQGGDSGNAGPGGDGGAIISFGRLTVTDSTIAGNATGRGGNGAGGGAGSGGEDNGSQSSGEAGGDGGGVESDSTSTVLTNDTFVNDSAAPGGTRPGGAGQGGGGGAIVQESSGVTQLTFVTVADNRAAGFGSGLGIPFTDGTITETDSIVANNVQPGEPDQCSQGVIDDAHNLVFGRGLSSDNSCPGADADPKLGALDDNGGPTQTLALQPGSAAIGIVPRNDCPQKSDQRGVARPQGDACDAGAYEFAPPAISGFTVKSPSPTTVTVAAEINPNLSSRQTSVEVTDGKSHTRPKLIGAGDAPAAFGTTLTGLTAGKRYHVQIEAANGDGTTITPQRSVMTRRSGQIKARIAFTTAFGPDSTHVLFTRGRKYPGGGHGRGYLPRRGLPVRAPHVQGHARVCQPQLPVQASPTQAACNRGGRGYGARLHRRGCYLHRARGPGAKSQSWLPVAWREQANAMFLTTLLATGCSQPRRGPLPAGGRPVRTGDRPAASHPLRFTIVNKQSRFRRASAPATSPSPTWGL
jgi:hypothetical protein